MRALEVGGRGIREAIARILSTSPLSSRGCYYHISGLSVIRVPDLSYYHLRATCLIA